MEEDAAKKKVDEDWKKKVQDEKEQAEETEPEREEQAQERAMPDASFVNFIATLQLQVLVSLGDVQNPATKKAEKDLQQAKYLINMLGVMQDKTRGNLEDKEKRLLDNVLYESRMRYVNACSAKPNSEEQAP